MGKLINNWALGQNLHNNWQGDGRGLGELSMHKSINKKIRLFKKEIDSYFCRE